MKHKDNSVIASKRNFHRVRVYIPEKIKKDGRTFVQAYYFYKSMPTTDPFVISFSDYVGMRINLLSNDVVMVSPFSKKLLLYYMSMVNRMLTGGTERFIITNRPDERSGTEWNEDFMKGKGEIVKR